MAVSVSLTLRRPPTPHRLTPLPSPPPPRQGLSEAGSEAEIAISGTGKLEDHG